MDYNENAAIPMDGAFEVEAPSALIPEGEYLFTIAQMKREMEMDELPPLSLEFKQYLMSKRPWKVLYINGKYYTSLQENSIPFTPNGEE